MSQMLTSDVLNPEILTDYVTAKFYESSELIKTGAVSFGDVDADIAKGGNVVTMPAWKIAMTAMQHKAEEADITLSKLSDREELSPVIHRYAGISINDLAKLQVKSDPNTEAGKQIAEIVGIDTNDCLVNVLEGAMGNLTANQYDYSATGSITATAVSTAKAKLGDFRKNLRAGIHMMHSKVENDLIVLGAVTYAIGAPTIFGDSAIQLGTVPNFMGDIIITDDELKKDGGDYRSFILGKGAMFISWQRKVLVETDRDIKQKSDDMTWDFHTVCHLKGVSYGSSAVANPTLAQLNTAGNWALNAESAKLVNCVRLQTT